MVAVLASVMHILVTLELAGYVAFLAFAGAEMTEFNLLFARPTLLSALPVQS
jgi:hypothetical protein